MSFEPAADIHEASNRFVDEFAILDPVGATYAGIAVDESKVTDYSPDGVRERAEHAGRYLRQVAAAEPADESQRVARAHFLERIGLQDEIHRAGLDIGQLNVIASPVQELRQVFDLMATDPPDDWAVIARRLANVHDAVAGIRASILDAAGRAQLSARRQVLKVAEQCAVWSGESGESFFATFVNGAVEGAPTDELTAAANSAAEAYGELG